jgi:hypothetical protein
MCNLEVGAATCNHCAAPPTLQHHPDAASRRAWLLRQLHEKTLQSVWIASASSSLQTGRCWTRCCWRRWPRCAACSCRRSPSTRRAPWCRQQSRQPWRTCSQTASGHAICQHHFSFCHRLAVMPSLATALRSLLRQKGNSCCTSAGCEAWWLLHTDAQRQAQPPVHARNQLQSNICGRCTRSVLWTTCLMLSGAGSWQSAYLA